MAGYASYLKKPLELFEELESKTIIFFDTETTGLHHIENQLTEVAAIAVKGPTFDEVGSYYKKVDLTEKTLKQIEIEKENKDPKFFGVEKVLKYNKYHDNKLPLEDEKSVVEGFVKFCGKYGSPILIAQNAKFDMSFIGSRAGSIPHEKVYDTKKMAEFYFLPAIKVLSDQDILKEKIRSRLIQKKNKPSSSLEFILKGFAIKQKDAHNSLGDVRSTITFFKKLHEYFKAYQDVADSPEFKQEQGKAFKTEKDRKGSFMNIRITEKLDKVASEMEKIDPVIALAIDKVSDQLEKQAGINTFIHRIFPRLPSKEEALKNLRGLDKNKLKNLIENVSGVLRSGPEGVSALDLGSIIKSIKTLGDPKIILSIIALMGAFNTTDAGIFSRLLGKEMTQEVKSPKQVLRKKIIDAFDRSPTAKRGYANIEIDGKGYSVGRAERKDVEMALEMSGINADEAAARKGQEEKEFVNKEIKNLRIIDEFQIETETGYIAYTVKGQNPSDLAEK